MRKILFALLFILTACVPQPRLVAPTPLAPTIRPQRLRAPAWGRQRCLELIIGTVQREDDIRFGDVVVKDVFGLSTPQRERPIWHLVASKDGQCRGIVVKNYVLLLDGSLYCLWSLSKPVVTSENTREKLVDLFRCAETAIRENKDPSDACGVPAEQGVGQ
jgi:hypothetical protein